MLKHEGYGTFALSHFGWNLIEEEKCLVSNETGAALTGTIYVVENRKISPPPHTTP